MIELMFVGVEERNPHQWNAEFVCAAIDDIAGYHKNVLTVLDPALRGYVGDIHAARIHRQSGSCIERGALRQPGRDAVSKGDRSPTDRKNQRQQEEPSGYYRNAAHPRCAHFIIGLLPRKLRAYCTHRCMRDILYRP